MTSDKGRTREAAPDKREMKREMKREKKQKTSERISERRRRSSDKQSWGELKVACRGTWCNYKLRHLWCDFLSWAEMMIATRYFKSKHCSFTKHDLMIIW
jgi:hypothetical protein